jgi:hypothetical protein
MHEKLITANNFMTEPGMSFIDKYVDLFRFFQATAIYGGLLSNIEKMGKLIFNNEILSIIEKHIEDDDEKKVLEAVRIIKEYNSDDEQTLDTSETSSLESFWIDFDIDSRLITYFIFSFFSYLGVLVKDLYKLVIKSSPPDLQDSLLNNYSQNLNPVKGIEFILKSDNNMIKRKIQEKFSNETLNKAISTMRVLRKIRNDIAHRDPAVPLSKIMDGFPFESRTSKEQMNEELSKMKFIDDEDESALSNEVSSILIDNFSVWFSNYQHSYLVENIFTPVLELLIAIDCEIYKIISK